MRRRSAFVRLTRRTKALLRRALLPVWNALRLVLGPVDRVLQPLANGYNRSLGRHFGEMTGLQFGILALGFGGIATVPFWSPLFPDMSLNSTLALAAIWAIFAMSWDIQSGYTGYISFGHSVLSGAAAYTIGLLLLHHDPSMGPALTIPLGVLAALVMGLVIAVPALRLRGPYFSLITLVGVLLFTNLVFAFSEWTQGELGINRPIDPFTYEPWLRYYYMVIPMFLIAIGLTYVARSNVGMVLVAIRENETAVSDAGLDPTKFKVSSFVLSSIPMGIGGSLLVYFRGGPVSPSNVVELQNSIEMIAIAVVGGMGSIVGPLFGAFLLFFLEEELLREFFEESSIRTLVLWLLVLGVLVFARNGVFRVLWHGLGAVGGDEE